VIMEVGRKEKDRKEEGEEEREIQMKNLKK
jgi:hypothetical protein